MVTPTYYVRLFIEKRTRRNFKAVKITAIDNGVSASHGDEQFVTHFDAGRQTRMQCHGVIRVARRTSEYIFCKLTRLLALLQLLKQIHRMQKLMELKYFHECVECAHVDEQPCVTFALLNTD